MEKSPNEHLTDPISRAEFLLSTFYENADEYDVYYCGDEKKQYCGELLNIMPFDHKAEINRNGMMQILPNGLFFDERELKENPQQSPKAIFDKHKQKKKKLQEFFHFHFDQRVFQTELRWEKRLSLLEPVLSDIILRELFNIVLTEDTTKEIKRLAQMIPGGQYLKGNVAMLALISQDILGHDILVKVSNNKVLFTVMIDDLNAIEFQEIRTRLKPYFNKLSEWFLPYNCICSFEIKAHERHFVLGKKLILNYNTRLWKRG